MTLKEQINNAIKDAMRAGDELRKTTLRMALSAIKLAEVQKGGPLDEATVLGLVQKEVKSRHEAIEDARKANRPDLEAGAHAEIAILQEFLPQALTSAELEQLVREAVAEAGATSPREMGKVMGLLTPRTKGRADGKVVSDLVKQMLQGAGSAS
ncbi:MAG: GatB/YqeY domain-containing protein [Anaerolineales bacterium]|nr:GatB/YqeY domain-containing protein [Anaerolineales bacterium]